MSCLLFSKIDDEAAALVPILNEYNILQIVVCFIAFISFTILNSSSLAVVYIYVYRTHLTPRYNYRVTHVLSIKQFMQVGIYRGINCIQGYFCPMVFLCSSTLAKGFAPS